MAAPQEAKPDGVVEAVGVPLAVGVAVAVEVGALVEVDVALLVGVGVRGGSVIDCSGPGALNRPSAV